jgi:acyl carrier protein
VRGFRIELGEIESVLAQHEMVRECVVITRADEGGEKRLVAYVIAQETMPGVDELRDFLKGKLPGHMVPSAFVMLDAMPLTPNGKLDRRALPAPPQSRPELRQLYVAARTPAEEIIAGVWSEVLGVERVGIHDDFFELGGHSLLATQVISRLREVFPAEVTLRHLFESPTVADLARRVERELTTAAGAETPPIKTASRAESLPLSFAQQRLWLIHQLDPNDPSYNIPAAVRLTGRLNIQALEQTLSEVVRRHEVLRTTFAEVGGQPTQVINPATSINLPVADLSGLTESAREAEVKRLSVEEARRPFDLGRGPLMRVGLLKLSEDAYVLLFTMHHIASDGWSMGVLVREVATLYEAFTRGDSSPLVELKIQYADFAAWQREWLDGEVLEEQLSYWKRQLAGAPPVLELPTDRVRTASVIQRGAHEWFSLPENLLEQLQALSRQHGVTLFMTLAAAFQTLLHRYTGQTDIVIGTDVANRNRRETEDLIGFFVNQLVLRTNLSGNPTFGELLAQVRKVTLDAYTHQDLPFDKLVEVLNPDRSRSRTPLFQAKLVLQNTPTGVLRLPELSLSLAGEQDTTGTAKFDLLLTMAESEQGLKGSLGYSMELFEAETIKRMVGHFETLLRSVASHADARLSELEIFSEEESRQRAEERKKREESKLKKFRAVKPKLA